MYFCVGKLKKALLDFRDYIHGICLYRVVGRSPTSRLFPKIKFDYSAHGYHFHNKTKFFRFMERQRMPKRESYNTTASLSNPFC